MGLINIMVTEELLTQVLYLDTSDLGRVHIVNANVTDRGDVVLTLENNGFPDRVEGEGIKIVSPTFQRKSDQLIDWRINV